VEVIDTEPQLLELDDGNAYEGDPAWAITGDAVDAVLIDRVEDDPDDAGHVLVVTGRSKFSSRDVFRTELRACETLLKRSKAESAEMRERMRANTVVILNMRDRIDELTGATS